MLWIDESRIMLGGTMGQSSTSSSSIGLLSSSLLTQSLLFSSIYLENSSSTFWLQLRSSSSTVFLARIMSSSLKSLFMFLGKNLKFFFIFSTHSWYILSQLMVINSLIFCSYVVISSFKYIFTMYPINSRDNCIFLPYASVLSLGLRPLNPSRYAFRHGSMIFHFISWIVAPKNSIYSSFSMRTLLISIRMRQSYTPSIWGQLFPFSVSFWMRQWASQVNSPLMNFACSSSYFSFVVIYLSRLMVLIGARGFILSKYYQKESKIYCNKSKKSLARISTIIIF